ncbi:hypothetical protein OH492_03365 [Vibrio chagasii]|nr:hypothetical protein [Vibrio chagasii]
MVTSSRSTQREDVYSANTGNTGIAIDDDMPVYQVKTTQSLHDYLLFGNSTSHHYTETDRSIAFALMMPSMTMAISPYLVKTSFASTVKTWGKQ